MENWTPVSEVSKIVEEVQAAFKSDKTQPIEWRKEQLKKIWHMLDVCILSAKVPPFKYDPRQHRRRIMKQIFKKPCSSTWANQRWKHSYSKWDLLRTK